MGRVTHSSYSSPELSRKAFVAAASGNAGWLYQLCSGDLSTLRCLLFAEIPTQYTPEYPDGPYTPLYVAARGGHLQVLQMAVGLGIGLDAAWKDSNSRSLLQAATSGGQFHVLRWLCWVFGIQSFQDLSSAHRTQLAEACLPDDRVHLLNVFIVPGTETHLLSKACCFNHDNSRCIHLLVGRGANLNTSALTPLVVVASLGHDRTARQLMALGADTNVVNERGYTPLGTACLAGEISVAQALIEGGADIDKRNGPNRITPIMAACSMGHISCVQLMIDFGADARR